MTSLPDTINGIVFGNVVLDAMPCELIHWQKDQVRQREVAVKDGEFEWDDRDITNDHLKRQTDCLTVPEGYLFEISPVQQAFVFIRWQKKWCAVL